MKKAFEIQRSNQLLELKFMPQKRVYKCFENKATGNVEINVTDENGHSIVKSVFDNLDETVAYFLEIKEELSRNAQMEIVEINDFHFECRSVENILTL